MAPPRRPNHLKVLAGCRQDRINRNEPTPTEATIAPATPLSETAQAIWDRLAPDRGGDTDPDDWARQWLKDNGLWDDNLGIPPAQYDLYPTSSKYRGPR